ncbi:MAG: hypothetical protein H0T86_01110 [Gemmatimonadales bacterium]|nr:hypothetical protein [Gemmatimonadales bacterium]
MVAGQAEGEAGAEDAPALRVSCPQPLLRAAREYDRKGHIEEAVSAYEAAIAAAELAGDHDTLAEALRRLAVVRCRQQKTAEARALCRRSEAVALEAGHPGLVAEALNTAGGIDLIDERFDAARALFLRASALDIDPDLRGRVEQNLGTVASTQGDHPHALERYRRSLTGFLAAANDHGCAVAYHNLGVVSIDLRLWAEADRYLGLCLEAVRATGDLHLRGLALLNRAEALIGLDRLREAGLAAESASGIFDELHAPRELADAYRVRGSVFRKNGELGRAQARLRLAVEFASASGCALSEAEASRELALVLMALGRGADAAALMAQAAGELERLKPASRPSRILAGEYPASVRAWGELLAVADPQGARHAERVAAGAVDLARLLGYGEEAQARLRIGACLHPFDPARLLDGTVPWDVGPMIRHHAERRDGSGPFGLRGDAIPLDAEILGIVDAHDTEPPTDGAAGRWWRADVVSAFRRIGSSAG